MNARFVVWAMLLVGSITGAVWAIGENGGGTENGDPAPVNVSNPSVTLEPVDRIEVVSSEARGDGPLSASGGKQPMTTPSRKVLGAWLLAMIGTSVALRSRRSRTA